MMLFCFLLNSFFCKGKLPVFEDSFLSGYVFA